MLVNMGLIFFCLFLAACTEAAVDEKFYKRLYLLILAFFVVFLLIHGMILEWNANK